MLCMLCMKMCVKELTLNANLLCVSVWVHIRAYVSLSVCVCLPEPYNGALFTDVTLGLVLGGLSSRHSV